jgi:heme/copper-type cytochrome/quinol oxidase subunit 2
MPVGFDKTGEMAEFYAGVEVRHTDIFYMVISFPIFIILPLLVASVYCAFGYRTVFRGGDQ